jgi:hypothetical protein
MGAYDFAGNGADVATPRSLAYEEWLGEPQSGDFDQGAGVSTSQLQNPNVSIEEHKAPASGTGKNVPALLQSPGVWLGLLALLVVVRFVEHYGGRDGEFKSIRLGLENWFKVGLLSATFLFAAKTLTTIYRVGPITQFFGSL